MLKSMTGFGKGSADLGGRMVAFEIKSLNSKQLDLNLRLPAVLRSLEAEMRAVVARTTERGKVEVTASIDYTGTELPTAINARLVTAYYNELLVIANTLKAPNSELLSIVMRMPEVTRPVNDDFNESDLLKIKTALEDALSYLDEFRKHEGALLENDFILRINTILSLLGRIEPYEAERNSAMREKLGNSFAAFAETNSFDQNRFEQEIIYYLEKLDITEEKVRLHKHCIYFLDTLKEENAVGRKLSFVTQEIGREINTLGSKANNAEIQKIVVEMKDELEKIKEQLANIL